MTTVNIEKLLSVAPSFLGRQICKGQYLSAALPSVFCCSLRAAHQCFPASLVLNAPALVAGFRVLCESYLVLMEAALLAVCRCLVKTSTVQINAPGKEPPFFYNCLNVFDWRTSFNLWPENKWVASVAVPR